MLIVGDTQYENDPGVLALLASVVRAHPDAMAWTGDGGVLWRCIYAVLFCIGFFSSFVGGLVADFGV